MLHYDGAVYLNFIINTFSTVLSVLLLMVPILLAYKKLSSNGFSKYFVIALISFSSFLALFVVFVKDPPVRSVLLLASILFAFYRFASTFEVIFFILALLVAFAIGIDHKSLAVVFAVGLPLFILAVHKVLFGRKNQKKVVYEKKVVISLVCIYIIIFIFIGELFSYLTLSIIERRMISLSYLSDLRNKKLNNTDGDYTYSLEMVSGINEIVHPYLGFVINSKVSGINKFGFWDKEESPVIQGNGNTINVGIFGGSVAAIFHNTEVEDFKSAIRQLPGNSEKEVKVFNFALGGYKQPQQLIALAYLLSLGAHFDIIINIDGFNEVALPLTDNLPKNVNAFFPRSWYARVGPMFDPSYVSEVGKLVVLKEERMRRVAHFNSTWLVNSYFANLFLLTIDRLPEKQIAELRLGLASSHSYADTPLQNPILGPDNTFSKEDAYQTLADQWKRSSIEMYHLAKENHITYIHILQPNQYLNKKRLTPKELKTAYSGKVTVDSPYREYIMNGYPYLIKAGGELIERGVDFHDETNIFSKINETLYVDTCCHFNKKGNDILLNEIMSIIVKSRQ